jgi:hypothetical protein
VIWARVFGVTSTTNPVFTAVFSELGLKVPIDNPVAHVNPLIAVHHTYVNPDTGVAPWQASLVTPIQIHILGTPASE